MKKALLLLTALSLPALLTGCGDPAQAKKEMCTKVFNEMQKARWGKAERSLADVKEEWKELQCNKTDVIQG
ncbi:TPA: hypothetical protein JG851_004665 [Vibrio parahaemolyticus]|nr:hypothetical protein [Vibrio parahaemolyticus]HBB9976679.1 hypothetical protein [Vibrio parahaemolyticus]HBC0013230.1 hypothetical protein [Vibrio parahaemolyticus]